MSWGEARRLALILLTDPSSRTCAAVRGWTSPIESSDVVLRDFVDLYKRINFKRPDAYPRPWHPQPKVIGAGTSVTAEEFRDMKRRIAEQN